MSLNTSTFLNQASHQKLKRNFECLKNSQPTTSSLQGNPLQNLQLASWEVLENAQKSGRSKCPRCGSSRMFYCYSCYVPVETVPTKEIPVVKLPLNIDIIKHPNETDGKSTAVHAKLLAPEDVTIYTYPCIPDYEGQRHEIALIFPGPNSVSVKDIALYLQKHVKHISSGNGGDSSAEPCLKKAKIETKEDKNLRLLQIELKTRKTCFWRRQKGKPDTYLATIEAIYYFLVEYHQEVLKESYKGQYDNLLFFFSFMYTLIKNAKNSAGKE
ncbi:tRNA-uridine aminocarboxypropyltransferase 1 isoform X2 [Carettochelys insculpta]|uniref:tRNA-uridine aminocarboxypropyltransferase 1 isoform X2 n=1 Tax=Carettochelys insculpta TaxID=44489 RepID=UPI003EBB80D2